VPPPIPSSIRAPLCTPLLDLKKLLPRPEPPGYNHPRQKDISAKRGECLIRVKVRMNESLDQLLKRFKKACEKEGLTRDIKRTAFYEKPSEKRRRQERQLIRKMQKEANLR
jgi:small subunit ribosomal protein S21